MYEGVHNLHHQRTRYGTAKDPEYLPLALMKPWKVPLFVALAALGPIGLIVRYGVLGPLSVIIPPLRRIVVERYSGLVNNPAFRRSMAEGPARRPWLVLETLGSIWAVSLIMLVATGVIQMHAFLIGLAIASGTMVLNQIRTLVAHLWDRHRTSGENLFVVLLTTAPSTLVHHFTALVVEITPHRSMMVPPRR